MTTKEQIEEIHYRVEERLAILTDGRTPETEAQRRDALREANRVVNRLTESEAS